MKVVGLAAIMLFGGYALSALGPVAVGWLGEATGHLTLAPWRMVGTAVALMAMSWWFVPAGFGRRRDAAAG